jgi:hypothetical protein
VLTSQEEFRDVTDMTRAKILRAALAARTEGVPVAPAEVVVCTKLLRPAMRDQADIVEMVKAGLFDRVVVGRYLGEHTPMLVGRWEALVAQAEAERQRGG